MPASHTVQLARKIAAVVIAPLVLAGFGLIHPGGLRPSTAEAWAELHIWLIPVWPLLALGLIVPLWGRPKRDAVGVATVVTWISAFGYATFYTGLDAVAGSAAGTAEHHGGALRRTVVSPLFQIGGTLGETGVICLGVAVLAASVGLFIRHGVYVLPGTAMLLVSCWSFYDSHIFMPRGVITMLGFAAGFTLLVLGTTQQRRA
jgi:hypothetical protein